MQGHSRYELMRHLAAGGMGEVFVARLIGAGDFEKKVALKLMQPHLVDSPELVARFYAEARLAARMHHPNIVEIFDVGDADGRPFIAMQLVEGASVGKVIKRLRTLGQRMPLPLVRLVAVGLCEALTYAHTLTDNHGSSLNVVHRDVTPSNILLSTGGAVLLTDFGIARVRDGGPLTEPGVIRGKMAYLAPEQVLHTSPVDARADLYSAAITLYELICGDNPLKAATPEETRSLLIRGAVPLVTTRRADVSKGMTSALERALRASPTDRFPTVRAFREAFIDGPVATGPDLATYVQHHFGAELEAMAAEPQQTGSYVSVTPTDSPAARPSEDRTALAPALDPPPAHLAEGLTKVGPVDPRATPPRSPPRARSNPSRPSVPRISAPRATHPRLEPTPSRWEGVIAMLATALVLGGATTYIVLKVRAPEVAVVSSPPADEPTEELPDASAAVAIADTPVRTVTPVTRDAGISVKHVATPTRTPRPAKQDPPPLLPLPEEIAARFGFLTVDAVPWAEVLENGALLERTPFVRRAVPAGRHTLLFRGPNGKNETRSVVVNPDEVTMIRVEFQ